MKIYTKKGDEGQTGLFGGARIPKDHLRIQTYGTLDELNAALGVALAASGSEGLGSTLRKCLQRVQGELFQLGAELATPAGKSPGITLLEDGEVQKLETEIDEMETKLSPLKTFILPGGTTGSAFLHLARTISRRAEREMVTLNRAEPLRPVALRYLNRLSDHLFVCARFANHEAARADVPWSLRG